MKKTIWISFIMISAFLCGVWIGLTKGMLFDYLRYGGFIVVENFLDEEIFSNYENRTVQFEQLSSIREGSWVVLGDSLVEEGLWGEWLAPSIVYNRGISGIGISGIRKYVSRMPDGKYRVFVMIGINDLMRGKNVNELFEDYKALLSQLHAKGIEVILSSTLFVGKEKPQFINTDVLEFNKMICRYANEKKIHFLNLNASLAPLGYLEEKYTVDGIHLNAQGYRIWVNEMKKVMKVEHS